MKRYLTLLVLAYLIIANLSAQENAQWRGPNRDGIYNETGLLKSWPDSGPALLWHYDDVGDGHASASVTKDRIYTAGIINGTGYVFSFSPDGKLLWKTPYGDEWSESWPGVRSTPLIYNGKIYILSAFGKLFCLKADNGEKIWGIDLIKDYDAQNIKWGMTENLLIDGNMLFCTPGGVLHNIIALDRNTGKLIWSCKGNGEKSAYCSPALIKLAKRSLIVTHTENSILCIDSGTGKLLWSHPWTNKYSVHANTPLYHEGYLYCVSGYGKGGVMLKLAADGSAKQEIWKNDSLDNRMGGVVLVDGKIYGSDDRNKGWRCIDWKTGKEIYSEKITNKGTIIYSDGMLYCYGDNGEIVLAQPTPDGFKKISSFKVPLGSNQHWAHLVIANGRLYVRHGGSLMVYDIRKK